MAQAAAIGEVDYGVAVLPTGAHFRRASDHERCCQDRYQPGSGHAVAWHAPVLLLLGMAIACWVCEPLQEEGFPGPIMTASAEGLLLGGLSVASGYALNLAAPGVCNPRGCRYHPGSVCERAARNPQAEQDLHDYAIGYLAYGLISILGAVVPAEQSSIGGLGLLLVCSLLRWRSTRCCWTSPPPPRLWRRACRAESRLLA